MDRKIKLVNNWCVGEFLKKDVPGTKYQVRSRKYGIENIECRILNQEEKHPTIIRILYFTELARSISIVFQFYLNWKLLGTLYFVLGTFKVLNTGFKISNAERRILNEEVAIRGPSEFVLLLDTNYLLLFLMSNAECRILNEEKHPTTRIPNLALCTSYNILDT